MGLKLAILGTGTIITEALEAISEVPAIEKTAILARPKSVGKAEAFAKRFEIGQVYTDYDRLLAESGIDTVYVGVINSVHYDYAKRALLAGKNAIVEKPFTQTGEEAQELLHLAKERGLYVFEAITSRHALVYKRLKEELPGIGRIRLVLGNYSQYSSRYDRYLMQDVAPAFDPAAGGGALNDLGVYPLSILVGLFGKPETCFYLPNRGFNGVDTSGISVFQYKDFTASLSAAKDCGGDCFFLVEGEKGHLKIPGAPNKSEALEIFFREKGELTQYRPGPDKNRMVQEFRDFAAIIEKRDYRAMEAEMQATIGVAETLERLQAEQFLSKDKG